MVEQYSIPILLNTFNRPKETKRVLSVIREIRPTVLFVHCDGPRADNEKDVINVSAVQHILDTEIDWPCTTNKLYEKQNLGCGKGPATSITWFFSKVDKGIILEDDCIPNPDFFLYCAELLDKYSDNDRIGIISGTCFNKKAEEFYSYRFTSYAGIWGWATWKRTWELFDFDFNVEENDFKKKVTPFLRSREATKYWVNILRKCKEDGAEKTYWDYQLHLSLMYAGKIHIAPNKNLVSNVGFNENATHTFSPTSKFANVEAVHILPLIHPEGIQINHKKDNRPYLVPVKRKIKKVISIFFTHR